MTQIVPSYSTYIRGFRSMIVIEGPIQLDEKTEDGTLAKWSEAYALLAKGLGSVVKALREVTGLPLVFVEPVVESGGLSSSWGLW